MLWKCHRISPQHMVVFLSLEIVLLSQGMKNPRFSNRGFTLLYVVLVCLREHGPADLYNMGSFSAYSPLQKPLFCNRTEIIAHKIRKSTDRTSSICAAAYVENPEGDLYRCPVSIVTPGNSFNHTGRCRWSLRRLPGQPVRQQPSGPPWRWRWKWDAGSRRY